ncbi:Transmembrane channel-like protein 7 [Araneus ventricosus]|uniref:Transmembrane channel-like protein 7 n=2 Tax=Araneus ventricosus TaxID=182803 RepID=A0A4Y2KF73_ARAVE|nr:Transmembrane channel-like protein 7 [Araneus ventricosus]
MKRNHKSKIPFTDGNDSVNSKLKSKNIPSNWPSERNVSAKIHASEDDLAVMQCKHPSKLPRIMHMKKDPKIGNVPERIFESRGKRSSDHEKPYYNENLRSEDQYYYSAGFGNRDDIAYNRTKETETDERNNTEISYHGGPYRNASSRSEDQNYYSAFNDNRADTSHARTKEVERDERNNTEISYHGRPYYNASSRLEDQNYYSAGYDNRADISHERSKEAEKGERNHTKISYQGRPYHNASSRSKDQNYYSSGNDNRVDISQKRTKERDKRSHTGYFYHGGPYYNEAISIEDEKYLSVGNENQIDIPHKRTKEDWRDRRYQLEFVKEEPSHTKVRYHSNLSADIAFGSEAVSAADYESIQNATEMHDAGHKINVESGAISKLFWTRKKNLSHEYHNRAMSIEDEKNYGSGNPKNKLDAILSFENDPEHTKDKKMMMHSRIHYHTAHSYDDSSTQEMNYDVSLKEKFQKIPNESENVILPNQIFEYVQTSPSHKMVIPSNSLQRGYSDDQRDFLDQPRSSIKIRKRHIAANDDDGDFQHIDDKNFQRNANARTITNVKPLTINDAYTVAEVMLGQPKQRASFTIDQQNSNAVIAESEDLTMIGRKCWSKICFSVSWHSHAVTHSIQGTSVVNREAILDTLPLGRPKDKSCWAKCLDIFGCFKHASAALELWNDSLKRIEGLQGTGVVSYFVFLRWLIALNLILFILYFLLITLPHAAFYVLPLKDINIAPNESLITEEFLNKYDSPRPTVEPKEVKNASHPLHSDDLFSNWGTLLENLPDNILDLTLKYNKKNYTTAERRNYSQLCEARYRAEMENNTGDILSAMQDLLQGTGWLQSTVLFLGHYPANEISYFGLVYDMPVAVIAVLFVSFVICLCMMIQYSSHGVQETILARKNDYLQYSNILFCSWDYCIEDRKSSAIRHNSILHEIKSTLAEEHRKREIKQWSRGKKIKVYFLRTFINLFVITALCSSYYLIYRVVNYQLKEMQLHRLNEPGVNTLFVQYLSPIVITGLNIFVPIIFNNIVKLEMYNTQTQINMALFRTVFLRLSSVFVLVGLLYQQITCEPRDTCGAGTLTETCRSPICWETYVGQQLYKLAVTDFFVYFMTFILYDIPRDVIVRHCKNKVTQMVGRQVFDLPNQVLSLVYSQTLCWLGVVYSPLLPAITVIKFVIIFYIKKQMVLKYCVPAPIPYKASRSNAMFMIILMLSFFTLMIIHGYSLSSVEPSAACSPFRYYSSMTEALSDAVLMRSSTFASIFNFLFSALFLIPAIILLCIAIYYYWTIVVAHRKMVKVLKAQIAIEGHDKQFLLNRLTEVAKGQFYK